MQGHLSAQKLLSVLFCNYQDKVLILNCSHCGPWQFWGPRWDSKIDIVTHLICYIFHLN